MVESNCAISVNRLTKHYQTVTALNDISFEVKRGELFGLIGPDGAGKTTLFRLLTTLLTPDEGSAQVEGKDIIADYHEIRKCVGYMPGHFSLYPDLTVEENLDFFASIFGSKIKDNYSTIASIYKQLKPFEKRRAGKLSGGMKQKLALCCALIHRPTVLLLDEPTTGVDAISRSEFWEMLVRLKQDGISILVSTPYMDEAQLCDRIGLIYNGKMLDINTPQRLVETYDEKLYALSGDDMYGLLLVARNNPTIKSCYSFGSTHHFTINEAFAVEAFKDALHNAGFTHVMVQPIQASIEDLFIKRMRHE